MSEEWRPVVGFEGAYSVSNLGRVKSHRRYRVAERIMRPSASGKGYRTVFLRFNELRDRRFVHEMVLEAFVGPRPPGMEVAHGNGVRDDNRLENLRWDTRSGNFSDKTRHGTATVGDRHGRRKLTSQEALLIRAAAGTCKEIGDKFGVGPMQVSRIKNRKNWGCLND